ncbi:TetR/AcrR family transcriptional regulator [Kitasatospora sp. NPDC092948]|uniref:TetR/AcrR family transcriptional regulator n=1 Tax=Kitasatospora sp. NPDC092948 TaxID=3364088 RepID=UPI00381F37B6
MDSDQRRAPAASARRGGSGQPRRADAERSIAAILAAAAGCFARDPQVSMGEIAAAAGVGRVTLYAHFPSREALLGELMDRALREVTATVAAQRLDREPADRALSALLRSSWHLLDRNLRMLHAARRALPAETVEDRHADILATVGRLITRGQDEGVFRADLPAHWLVTSVYTLILAAGDQVESGRFTSAEALAALEATVAPALRSA